MFVGEIMPMGFGVHYVGSEGVAINPFYDILWMIIFVVIIAVIIYILISPLKKQSSSIDNEKLIKIEKDVEEIKEIVKELKKKWEEIE
ncbi:hypothetical protein MJ_0230 [Methanocaldococcus jannaschii DSM 2661]|uniref:Uncharacterized protein MJ0230 n=2 Tax=Methanocaldococcus jannaschii TaxID=2190 RepID=Y230_METJA|nr:RecName: Full=Uncharacterized protein MJ0230 [Methanocaldococcus jannaschii DSM 2661]AAB98216.1 hypothetical protein MJ_0230 [Methanocaldococcus jannaschii DSM 2661]